LEVVEAVFGTIRAFGIGRDVSGPAAELYFDAILPLFSNVVLENRLDEIEHHIESKGSEHTPSGFVTRARGTDIQDDIHRNQ
jgi:hypothetical protein